MYSIMKNNSDAHTCKYYLEPLLIKRFELGKMRYVCIEYSPVYIEAVKSI